MGHNGNWASFGCGIGWACVWWGNGLYRCIGKDGFMKSDIATSKKIYLPNQIICMLFVQRDNQ